MKLGLRSLALAAICAAIVGSVVLFAFELVTTVGRGVSQHGLGIYLLVYSLVAACAFPICLAGLFLAQFLASKLGLLHPDPKVLHLIVLGICLGTVVGLPIAAFANDASLSFIGALFGGFAASFALLSVPRDVAA